MIEYIAFNKGELCNGSTADSDSVCWGSNPYSPAKKSSFFGTRIFLSKPQAWHIIAARSAAHIIKGGVPPLYLITRQRASYLRLDDIQTFGLMICRNKLRMI